MKHFLHVSVALMLVMIFTGCYSGRTVVVERPAPKVIVRPPQPRPGYRWEEGRWSGHRKKQVWRDGYWRAPGRKYYRY